nr:MAG TPA: hypothetical protein [Caudoviricetes sp.]DAO64737.1 MAG TPA: hypothetical protein [Caudoviricetes sp.]
MQGLRYRAKLLKWHILPDTQAICRTSGNT